MIKFHEDALEVNGKIKLLPSEFVAYAMRLPINGELEPFSFEGRRYLKPIYNTPSPRVLLMCGRQVEKSTTLGNIALVYSTLRKHFRTLFVSPTQQQTETFSRDKVRSALELSPALDVFFRGPENIDNVLYKKFAATYSDITLRYAFLHADRIRGISADMLLLDEVQDILTDVIPIIEEALSHSEYRILRYSGTPKSLDNTISYYWENFSTQNEWVIPCEACNHWNVIGEDNLGKHYLICSKCGDRIYPDHPKAQWASMNPNPKVSLPFEGYRISQLITKWADWAGIIDKYERYTRREFYNEVLGRGYDVGDRPLTKADMRACCDEARLMYPEPPPTGGDYYMGVDWGTGENSYTVMIIAKYDQGKFRLVFAKRFEGKETDPTLQLDIITQYIKKFNIRIVGTDYGGGYDRNDVLLRRFGIRKIARYQYVNTRKKVYYDKDLGRFMVNRNGVLRDVVAAVARGNEFLFPAWSQFEYPFGQDMTNIVAEYNEARREVVYNKPPGVTDDTLHAFTYCFLASMITNPRPDILSPVGVP